MLLTDVKIKNAKPAVKAYKLYDERGLFLIVAPKGGKWWRFKYRFDDKEKLLFLGVYPDIGLRDARNRRDEARRCFATRAEKDDAAMVRLSGLFKNVGVVNGADSRTRERLASKVCSRPKAACAYLKAYRVLISPA